MTWYFVRTPFPWVLAISFGMGLLGLLEYKPEVVSHDALWLLGDLTRLLANDYPLVITLIWYPAVAAHIGEAIYAYRLAKSMKLSQSCCAAWFGQTLCFGYASLYYLKLYKTKTN